MKKIKIWWMAWICDYPFFRVIYKDGDRTHTLNKRQAKSLRDVFSGKLIIDYEYAENFINLYQ